MRRRSRRIYAFAGLLVTTGGDEARQGLGPFTRPSPLHQEPLESQLQHRSQGGLERSDRIKTGSGRPRDRARCTRSLLNLTSSIALKAVWSAATEKPGIKLRLRSYEQCNDDSTNKESNT